LPLANCGGLQVLNLLKILLNKKLYLLHNLHNSPDRNGNPFGFFNQKIGEYSWMQLQNKILIYLLNYQIIKLTNYQIISPTFA
jgi:hypothetical protein